jgi:hypothetical protein
MPAAELDPYRIHGGASDLAQGVPDLKPKRAAANQARNLRSEEEEDGREGEERKEKVLWGGLFGRHSWPPPPQASDSGGLGCSPADGVETEVGSRPCVALYRERRGGSVRATVSFLTVLPAVNARANHACY